MSEAPVKKRKSSSVATADGGAPLKTKKAKKEQSKYDKKRKADGTDEIVTKKVKKVKVVEKLPDASAPASVTITATSQTKKARSATKASKASAETDDSATTKQKEAPTSRSATKVKGKDKLKGKPVPESLETTSANSYAETFDDDASDDDQTEAFLKGFDSDGNEEAERKDGGLKPDGRVPSIPTMTNQNTKKLRRLAQADAKEEPGVVYVGRIPHGFYELEMKAYFEQFGKILRLRLSRNKKTGQSKHHAWIEFESATVAEIVAKSMDNYLLFNHILKVKLVPAESVPENLFKGANRRFKVVPWNKMAGRALQAGATEDVWEKRNAKEQQRRSDKAAKLKAIGYDFEPTPLKSAVGLAEAPVQAIEASDEPLAITDGASDANGGAVEAGDDHDAATQDTENAPDEAGVTRADTAGPKKEKKRKSTTVHVVEAEVISNGKVAKKSKKFKKTEVVA